MNRRPAIPASRLCAACGLRRVRLVGRSLSSKTPREPLAQCPVRSAAGMGRAACFTRCIETPSWMSRKGYCLFSHFCVIALFRDTPPFFGSICSDKTTYCTMMVVLLLALLLLLLRRDFLPLSCASLLLTNRTEHCCPKSRGRHTLIDRNRLRERETGTFRQQETPAR